jgi:hypothetical protein
LTFSSLQESRRPVLYISGVQLSILP